MPNNHLAPIPIRAIRLGKKDDQGLRFSWSTFLSSVNSLRERPIRFTYISDSSPNKNCIEWLKSDSLIYEWVKSANCLRSPRKWPRGVLPAFKHRLIPSPFEICNVDMRRSFPRRSVIFVQHLKMTLYCLGFSLGQLSTFLGESERDIERDIYCAIEALFEWPQFTIWATATDFSKSLLPPHVSSLPLVDRGKLIIKLKKNPFLLTENEARPFLDSPRYLTYLVYGSPKKPRVTKDCRLYYTKEG